MINKNLSQSIYKRVKNAKRYSRNHVQQDAQDKLNLYEQKDNSNLKSQKFIKSLNTRDIMLTIQAMLPTIYETFITGAAISTVLRYGSKPENAEIIKMELNKFNNEYIFNKPKYSVSQYTSIKSSLITGLGVIKIIWKQETEKNQVVMNTLNEVLMYLQEKAGMEFPDVKIDSIEMVQQIIQVINSDDNPYTVTFEDEKFIVTEEIIVNEYPEFSYVNLADFYYYPDAQVIAQSSVIAERIRMTKREIMDIKDPEIDIKDSWLGENKWKIATGKDTFKTNNRIEEAVYTDNESDDIDEFTNFEVMEVYARVNGTLIRSYFLGKECIRQEEFVYKTLPYGIYQYDFSIDQLDAETISDTVQYIQSIRTNILRQLVSNIYNQNNPRVIVDKNAVADGSVKISDLDGNSRSRVILAKSGAIDTNTFAAKSLPADGFNILNVLTSEREFVSGINRLASGVATSGQSTATEIIALRNETQKKIRLIIRLMAQTGFSQILDCYTNMLHYHGILPKEFYLRSEMGLGYVDNLEKAQKLIQSKGMLDNLLQIGRISNETYLKYIRAILDALDLNGKLYISDEALESAKIEDNFNKQMKEIQMQQQQMELEQQMNSEPISEEIPYNVSDEEMMALDEAIPEIMNKIAPQ